MLSHLPTEAPARRPDAVVAFESRLLPILVRLREQPWVLAAMTAPEPPAQVFRALGPGELWVPLTVAGRKLQLLFRWHAGAPERDTTIALAADAARSIASQVDAEERAAHAAKRAARAERRWAKEHVAVQEARAEVERVRASEGEVKAQLRNAEERAVTHNPIRAVSGLLAGLAHDIRSPLTSILCNVQSLEEELVSSRPDLAAVLADAKIGCERVEALVSSVRLFTDPVQTAVSIDAAECVQTVVRLSRLDASRAGVQIDVSVEAGLTLVCNPTDACQALYHVLRNAIEASPRGRTVELRARRVESGCAIEIRDSGAGIAAADREHLFAPFRSRRPGVLGASLANAQALLRKHGGDLLARDPEAGTAGAVFELRFATR